MKPIYKPKGRALEYSPDALACNIYTGCPHRCYYCFAPQILKKDREVFHSHVEPRKGIVEAVKKQLEKGEIRVHTQIDGVNYVERIELKNKLIHLCFTCDPYPIGYDTSPTREIIKAIKESGNHVQILTKGDYTAQRDFDLLDKSDWFGITLTGAYEYFFPTGQEPFAAPPDARVSNLRAAKTNGINTWISAEPVIVWSDVLHFIESKNTCQPDLYRIGKLNYHPSETDWHKFGHDVENACTKRGVDYYIKDDLRKEMEKS